MAILHGSWLLENKTSGLFIWGETWRKIGAIDIVESAISLQHPLAMTEAELETPHKTAKRISVFKLAGPATPNLTR